MNQMELLEQLKNDSAFIEQIRTAADNEEIAKLFAAKGIDVDANQIAALCEAEANDELNESELDNVAGGYIGVLAGVGIILFLAGVARGARCKN